MRMIILAIVGSFTIAFLADVVLHKSGWSTAEQTISPNTRLDPEQVN